MKLKILECDTRIRARELLYAKLDKNILKIDRGFGTNITRGYLVSQPSERDMNGFSVAFTPPDFNLRADTTNNDSFVEEQAAHGKVSDETLKMMTSYTARYPKDYNELRHFIKNFSDISGLLFGSDSIFNLAVKDVCNHVMENERSYSQGFLDKWYFGASVVDKIHICCQKFMRSCTQGDPAGVSVMALNFGEMLDKIFMNEYVALLPHWVEKTKKRDNENQNGGGPNKRQNHGNYGQGGGTQNLPAHHLRDWEKGMRLQPNERYYRVFHYKNGKCMDKPKTKNGTEMCLRFYGTGVCFGNCNKAHSVLDQDEKDTWRKYITHCRHNHDNWQNGMKKDNNNEKKTEKEENKEKKEDGKTKGGEKKNGEKE